MRIDVDCGSIAARVANFFLSSRRRTAIWCVISAYPASRGCTAIPHPLDDRYVYLSHTMTCYLLRIPFTNTRKLIRARTLVINRRRMGDNWQLIRAGNVQSHKYVPMCIHMYIQARISAQYYVLKVRRTYLTCPLGWRRDPLSAAGRSSARWRLRAELGSCEITSRSCFPYPVFRIRFQHVHTYRRQRHHRSENAHHILVSKWVTNEREFNLHSYGLHFRCILLSCLSYYSCDAAAS